jgi:katanin p80 WD40 repeat-containing subunit B1
LSGHRSSITSLKFHPFGDFFASSSTDNSIKLWDIRRKGCIQTYQGHSEFINDIEITPDGRWLCSCSNDSTIKIWDIIACKLIKTIISNSTSIKKICFNPSEYVLASTSENLATVYDLQTFECISEYFNRNIIDTLCFNGSDELIFGDEKGIRIMNWDPIEVLHDIQHPMNIIKDIGCRGDGELVVCSLNGNFIHIRNVKVPVVFKVNVRLRIMKIKRLRIRLKIVLMFLRRLVQVL